MSTSYNPKVVTDGLIFALDAANKKSYPGSGAIWTDLIGNDVTGSLTGNAVYVPENLGAIQFGTPTGGKDGVTINTPISSSFATYEVWARGTRSSDYGFIMFNGSTGFITQTYMGIIVENTTEPLINAYVNAGLRTTMRTDVTASINSTYHICLVVSGTQQTNYVNGIQQKTASTGTPANYDSVTYLGDNLAGTRGLSGSLYVVKFYNRPLSPSEVLQNFNATRNRFGV